MNTESEVSFVFLLFLLFVLARKGARVLFQQERDESETRAGGV